jgi:hypothetical protein
LSNVVVRPWYNASSNDGSSCVDVQMYANGDVEVRNSKDPDGPIVGFTSDEWAAFITGANAGKFDPLP